jgi:hypothetical protein
MTRKPSCLISHAAIRCLRATCRFWLGDTRFGPSLPQVAIIERVRTGMSARATSNHENPLALLECGGYDSLDAALNARRRCWLE